MKGYILNLIIFQDFDFEKSNKSNKSKDIAFWHKVLYDNKRQRNRATSEHILFLH